MPLTIQRLNNQVCPIVVCDACGKKIAAGRDGNYEWNSDEVNPVVYFSHKECTNHLRALHGDVDLWSPLSALPAFLLFNLKLTWEDSEDSAEFTESV